MHRLIKRSITIVTTTIRKFSWYETAQDGKAPRAMTPRASRPTAEERPDKEELEKKSKSH